MTQTADPIYEFVDLETAPGYEYCDRDGQVYGPFPAVALFAWGLKGLFPPDSQIRIQGRREFHPLSAFERDIFQVARVQLTNHLMDGNEWFYLDSEGKVQGPFPADKMLAYIAARYIPETIRLYGRPLSQSNQPRPRAESGLFRAYADLLTETVEEFRAAMKKWREQRYGQPVTQARPVGHTAVPRNTVPEGNGIPPPTYVGSPPNYDPSKPRTPPTPHRNQHSSSPPHVQSGHPPTDHTFGDLAEMYMHRLFSQGDVDWYVRVGNEVYGPTTYLGQLQSHISPDLLITSVPSGSGPPRASDYKTLMDLLLHIHRHSS